MSVVVDAPALPADLTKSTEPASWSTRGVGIVAAVALSASLGVLLMAFADVRSRASQPGAYLLFWVALALIFVPVAALVSFSTTGRNQRLAVVAIFGLALYLVKCLYSPTVFVFHDEYAHLRTILNLIDSGRLFGFNPEIRVAADYPGLGLVTLALSKVTGLSLVSSGEVIIGAARLLLMLALFLLLERLTGSDRAAGVGCLIYAGNANFLYWDAQFAYESLALPLAIATVYLLLRRSDGDRDYTAPALLVAAMVVITHHLTTYALVAVLGAWTAVAYLRRSRRPATYAPWAPTATIATATGLWLAVVAPLTLGYLLPVFGRTLSQGLDLLLHQKSSRVLFANPGGAIQPRWEQAMAFGAVLFVVAVVPFGLVVFRRRWPHPLATVLAWSPVLYLLMLPLRFTSNGQEAANRSGEFLFVGIGLIAAMVLVVRRDGLPRESGPPVRDHPRLEWLSAWRRIPGGIALASFGVCLLMFVGGVAVSWSYANRLPQPIKASDVPLVPTPDVVAAARWMQSTYGSYHRVATDITTGLAFDTVGDQNVLSGASYGSHIWRIFEPTTMTGGVYSELAADNVEFVVIQHQLTEGLPPIAGVPVYDEGEPLAADHKAVPVASQAKFDGAAGLSMVYASRTITIYQVDLAQVRLQATTR
jgi:hypothetical protein